MILLAAPAPPIAAGLGPTPVPSHGALREGALTRGLAPLAALTHRLLPRGLHEGSAESRRSGGPAARCST